MNNGIKHLPRSGRKKVGIFDIDSLFHVTVRFCASPSLFGVYFSQLFFGIFVALPLRSLKYIHDMVLHSRTRKMNTIMK